MLSLPPVYADVLRLRDANADNRAIAKKLGVELHGVPLLIYVAELKLARLLSGQQD